MDGDAVDVDVLEFDAAAFSGAVRDDFDGVMRLFRNGGDSSHAKVSFVYATDNTRAGEYLVDVTTPATRDTAAGTTPAPHRGLGGPGGARQPGAHLGAGRPCVRRGDGCIAPRCSRDGLQ